MKLTTVKQPNFMPITPSLFHHSRLENDLLNKMLQYTAYLTHSWTHTHRLHSEPAN